MPWASDAQRRLMEGIEHGWKPSHMKNPPSKAVAEKFTEHATKMSELLADRKRRKRR